MLKIESALPSASPLSFSRKFETPPLQRTDRSEPVFGIPLDSCETKTAWAAAMPRFPPSISASMVRLARPRAFPVASNVRCLGDFKESRAFQLRPYGANLDAPKPAPALKRTCKPRSMARGVESSNLEINPAAKAMKTREMARIIDADFSTVSPWVAVAGSTRALGCSSSTSQVATCCCL